MRDILTRYIYIYLFAPMSTPTRKVETYADGQIKSERWKKDDK
jgi:hypothetical protein